jgi:transposase
VATVFTIAGTRGAKVIREMLGENYNRVLTSDRWTAYTWLKRRQLCWAHLRRDFQAMIDRDDEGSLIGKSLLELSDQLFESVATLLGVTQPFAWRGRCAG